MSVQVISRQMPRVAMEQRTTMRHSVAKFVHTAVDEKQRSEEMNVRKANEIRRKWSCVSEC
jgi:hypothetical protein